MTPNKPTSEAWLRRSTFRSSPRPDPRSPGHPAPPDRLRRCLRRCCAPLRGTREGNTDRSRVPLCSYRSAPAAPCPSPRRALPALAALHPRGVAGRDRRRFAPWIFSLHPSDSCLGARADVDVDTRVTRDSCSCSRGAPTGLALLPCSLAPVPLYASQLLAPLSPECPEPHMGNERGCSEGYSWYCEWIAQDMTW